MWELAVGKAFCKGIFFLITVCFEVFLYGLWVLPNFSKKEGRGQEADIVSELFCSAYEYVPQIAKKASFY